MPQWVAVGLVLSLLVLANLATTRWLDGAAVVVAALVVTALLLLVGTAAGLSWDAMGLGRTAAPTGLRWALAIVALVALAYGLVLLVPGGPSLLTDDRTPDTLGAVALEALVVIPLRTVLLEEVGFRGVLWGLLERVHGTRAATALSSAAFGVWHVLPAVGFASANATAGDVLGRSAWATTVVVIGTIVVTGAAGVLLCELRRRSGSLLAPMALHWAANGVGTLAAFAAAGVGP